MQSQQNQLRIETDIGQECGVYSTFNLKRSMGVVRARERIWTNHAVAHHFRCRSIGLGRRFIADRVILQQVDNGEFDPLWNEPWMNINGPQRLVELAEVSRAAKDTQQAK